MRKMMENTERDMERKMWEEERRAHYQATDDNDRMVINLRDINHTMRALYEGRGSQKRILIMLLEAGTITQRRLTERLGIQPGSASEVLAKLERGGLIVRTESPDDRRTTDITLTEQGRLMGEEATRQRNVRHEEMFSCLTAEEKKTLLSLLEKVNDDWKERYRGMTESADNRHGRGGCHDHSHEHGEEGGRSGCDGNCRECPHPCGRGRRLMEGNHGAEEASREREGR